MIAEKGKLLNRTNLILLGVSVLLFTYVVIRAILLSYTFDEVSSYWIMRGDDWFKLGNTANNHFLNTLLMKATYACFGTKEIALRLPNVLAYGLFLFYSIKIGSLAPNKYAKLIGLILLSSMPFLIDFFSLARGYGLSLSLMLPSLYYLFKFSKLNKLKYSIFSILFASLAVLSNFTLLNYYLSDFFVIGLLILFLKEPVLHKLKRIGTLLLFVIPFILAILPLLLELKNGDQLYFGGRTGFLKDTVNSLGRTFAYLKLNRGFGIEVFRILFFLTLAISISNLVVSIKKRSMNYHTTIAMVFLLCIAAPMLQNLLFETNYPIERTALLYYPLMIIVLIFGVFNFQQKLHQYFVLTIAAGFLCNFILSVNFTHTYSWRYDSGTKHALKTIEDREKSNMAIIHIGINSLFAPSVDFYKMKNNITELTVSQVAETFEYHLDLEEFDLAYFGVSVPYKIEMTKDDIDRMIKGDYDYLYLDKFLIDQLKQHSIKFKTVDDFPFSRTSLITNLKY